GDGCHPGPRTQVPAVKGTHRWRVTAPPAVVGPIPRSPPHLPLPPRPAGRTAYLGQVRSCAVGR
ncbi:MAG: hypothetical protein ACRDTT_05330, partial [Pseudonocardiaceae bacterium]